MNDDKEQANSRQSASDPQSCCDGGSCCTSSSDDAIKRWKIIVFILILLAAGVVLARSFIRKANSSANQGQQQFAIIQPESGSYIDAPSIADGTTEAEVSNQPALSLWGKPLNSLASLGEAASDTDAVFILLAAEDQQDIQPITKEIEAAAKTIQAGGTRISAFRLMPGAPNYENLTKQLSDPCVLAMVKGCGLSGIPADQITETKLVQAFVAASRPASGCCPPGVPCEPTK
ncbi:MAG: hypothetical protein ACYSUX_04990 [Planctomycetota bacterium]|jgi:hypothetical protein